MVAEDNVIPFPGGRRGPGRDELDALARDLIEKTGSPQQALAALMGLLDVHPPVEDVLARRRPELLPRLGERAAFVVRVDLDGAKPPIWRRLRLASDLTLAQLHDILQVAVGWADSHLHQLGMGPRARDPLLEPFLTPYDLSEGEQGIPEAGVHLDQVLGAAGDRLYYDYDFGDDWKHTIKLEKVEPWADGDPVAACLDGRRACPPEDVGGLWGYQEMLEALAGPVDPDDEEVAERLAWLPPGFDPEKFSVAETDLLLADAALPTLEEWHPAVGDLLARVGGSALSPAGALVKQAVGPWELDDDRAAAATHRYRHLLATVGEGLKLTAAGYLPPRVVETLYRELDMDDGWWGKGNREDQTFPVLWLRESATALGLVRKYRGQLVPTKLGRQLARDPRRMLAHIASRLPRGRHHEQDAGLLALLFTAAGAPWREARVEGGGILMMLGWRVEGDIETGYLHWARPTMEVFDNLVDDEDPRELRALIARAVLHRPPG